MWAVRFSKFGGPEVLGIGDVAAPHAGPGEIRIAVRAAGVSPTDAAFRAGRIRAEPPHGWPHIPGVDAAGVVDEIGAGVSGVRIGDEVFGAVDVLGRLGGASAGYAVLQFWAPKPAALSWAESGGAATGIETATRALDALGVGAGADLLIDGGAGGVGCIAVQLAVARGARVTATARPENHELLASLGAVPTTYGPGLADRVRHADLALDIAGAGSIPELVALTGDPGRVLTIADLSATEHGVRLSWSGSGDPDGRAGLLDAHVLRIPLRAVLPVERAAQAHRAVETGHGAGKVVLVTPGRAGPA